MADINQTNKTILFEEDSHEFALGAAFTAQTDPVIIGIAFQKILDDEVESLLCAKDIGLIDFEELPHGDLALGPRIGIGLIGTAHIHGHHLESIEVLSIDDRYRSSRFFGAHID